MPISLVTGGAGFIGSHVVDALAGRGCNVLCVDSLDAGVHHSLPDYLRDDVEYCFADLRYFEPDSRFNDIEAIVHLAGAQPGSLTTSAARWKMSGPRCFSCEKNLAYLVAGDAGGCGVGV